MNNAQKAAAAKANFYRGVAERSGEVLEPTYLGANRPHRCRCSAGHECSPRPNDLQQGRGMCRACAGKDPDVARNNFHRQVDDLGGVVQEPEWLGNNKPHRCRCANGHECFPRPANVAAGHRMCRICAGNDSDTARDSFYARVAGRGGEVLEPEWLGVMKLHRCRCVKGHLCCTRPNDLQQGAGMCWTCSGRNTVVARDSFYRLIIEQGGEVLEKEWGGSRKPHRCRCAKGHECSPRPADTQRGKGICQVCSWAAQDVLYLVRDSVARRVKFGITGRDGSSRLNDHRRAGYTQVLRLYIGLPEGLAALTERKIKLALAMAGVKPAQGREYFSDEYLALIDNELSNGVGGYV